MSFPRTALIHDWLTGMRGGEKVLELLCELLPAADLFTLIHLPGRVSATIEARRIRTSFLQRLPGVGRYYRWLLPAMPAAIEALDLADYDLVISSSHCVAKGARAWRGAAHLCYCHTPMRYVWELAEVYFPPQRFAPPLRQLIGWQLERLRRWDRDSAARVTEFVANSAFVAERIRRHYGRTASVIHPPVDTDFFTPAQSPRSDYWLVVAALVPYKRTELALEACEQHRAELVIVGDGPERKRLQRLAGPRVRFTGWVDATELRELYRGCRGLIFPGVEDFGIVPLEVNACGKPVVGLAQGGLLETQIEGQTAVLFQSASAAALGEALDRCQAMGFNPRVIRENALRFARPRCRAALRARIESIAGAALP
jgi:glycosyltransferase involved in cell wall biosynthesis